MKQTSWVHTNFTSSSLQLFHIISFSTFDLCKYNKANNSYELYHKMLKHNPKHAQRTMANLTQNICLFFCAKNQIMGQTQTDRVNGFRPSLLQLGLGLGLGFKELVPWASIILAASATCCCWGRISAFYLCASSSASGRCVAGVCLGSRCISGNYTARYYHCFNSLFASFAFLFSCFLITSDGSPLRTSLRRRLFLSCKYFCFEGKFRFFLPPILFGLLLLYCCLLPVFHVPCVHLSDSWVPFVLVHIFSSWVFFHNFFFSL